MMRPSVLEPSLDLGVAQAKTPRQTSPLLDTGLKIQNAKHNTGLNHIELNCPLLDHIIMIDARISFPKGGHFHNHHHQHHCCCPQENNLEIQIVIKIIFANMSIMITSGICAAQMPIPTVEVARRRKPS